MEISNVNVTQVARATITRCMQDVKVIERYDSLRNDSLRNVLEDAESRGAFTADALPGGEVEKQDAAASAAGQQRM